MKIFLSWSGENSASHQVAQAFRDWLPNVIQSLDPFISSEDILKGSRPSIELAHRLQEHSFGIICVTKKSIDSRWLNFEAGALSKELTNSSVYPFLFRMRPSDVRGPLAGFQQAIYQEDEHKKEEVWKLIAAINKASAIPLISLEQLHKSFGKWWPDLQTRLDAIEDDPDTSPVPPATDTSAAIEEMLRILREQQITARSNRVPQSEQPVQVELTPTRRFSADEMHLYFHALTPEDQEILLNGLTETQQQIVQLHFGASDAVRLSITEVAQNLGIPRQSASNNLRTALLKMEIALKSSHRLL